MPLIEFVGQLVSRMAHDTRWRWWTQDQDERLPININILLRGRSSATNMVFRAWEELAEK